MWPFRRRPQEKKGGWGKPVKRLVVGLIIGGAIGSIVGKTLSEKGEDETKK